MDLVQHSLRSGEFDWESAYPSDYVVVMFVLSRHRAEARSHICKKLNGSFSASAIRMNFDYNDQGEMCVEKSPWTRPRTRLSALARVLNGL